MRWSMLGLVMLGLVAAVSAAGLVSLLRPSPRAAEPNAAVAKAQILVAAKPLRAMSIISPECIVQKSVSVDQVPAGSMADPVGAVGKVLGMPLEQGQALTAECFVKDNAGMRLAAVLPAGKRAVSIMFSEGEGLEPVLVPGSVVDVLATFSPDTRADRDEKVCTVLLEAVEVLSIEDRTVVSPDAGKIEPPPHRRAMRLVTLMVDISQAQSLQLAMARGTIALALRNPGDETIASAKPVRTMDLAGALPPNTAGETAERPPVMAASEPAAPAATPASWRVTILRGQARETQEFVPLPP